MKKSINILGRELFSWDDGNVENKQVPLPIDNGAPDPKILPPKRLSYPPYINQYIPDTEGTQILLPEFYMGLIPVLRTLSYINPNLSQALGNIVELGNTGHNIQFDPTVSAEDIVKMRQHIQVRCREWAVGATSVDSLVNKMMAQIMIGGALSNEWVPKMDLSGIKQLAFVNPETIRWGYDRENQTYKVFQLLIGFVVPDLPSNNLIPLNQNTFRYYPLNGDMDTPYGIPPYLSAMDPLKTQKMMLDNIKFLTETVGIAGFMEMLLEKPEQLGGEKYDAYITRLNVFLQDAKKRMAEGMRDGVSVGFKEDMEFKFHSTTKAFGGVSEFFQLNELLFASGLKMDASMLGRNYGTSESQISIIFTKLLSQLKNIQQICAANLEYGYSLELRLAGYSFKTLKVAFNPSTALDELKAQQADEIKVRNLNQLYKDGIISQEQYAHAMDYESPSEKEPRFIPTTVDTPQNIAAAKKAENAAKKGTDKKAVQKKKPQQIPSQAK